MSFRLAVFNRGEWCRPGDRRADSLKRIIAAEGA
jgi:hypothetical protein